MKLSLSFITVPRFFKFLTILLLLTLLIVGFVFLMKYRQKLSPIEKAINSSITEVKITLFPSPTLPVNKNSGQWQTYSEYGSSFTFEYPGSWTAQTINSQLKLINNKGKTIVSFSSFDPALVGITYCGANAGDPRCEGNIDWGNGSSATAEFSEYSKGITMTLHEVNTETKDIFRHIVKTFHFLNTTSTNVLMEKVGSEEKLSGRILENKHEEVNSRTKEYLIVAADTGEKYRVIYNDAGKFDACTNADSGTARTLKPGQKIELFGIFSSDNEISTCNSSDYYIRITK
jgi:hypothetical protein